MKTDWIIVVDDDVTNLKLAGHILSAKGKKVTALKSGQMLLKYLEENRPDLILLDIKMPEMDGFETLAKLREKEKESGSEEIPVIFLTANEEEDAKSKALSMGVSDLVQKPFDSDDLLMRIEKALGQADDNPGAASAGVKSTQQDIPWVVVVDDDISNLKLAGSLLSKYGMRVTAIRSGQALLEQMKEGQPDLVLLDILMPDMDGFEAYEKFRALGDEKAQIPVIFLSADESTESECRGLRMGGFDFIRKPFVPDLLLLRVQRALEFARLKRNQK